MIGRRKYPIERDFGPEIGKMMADMHEENGVTLHMEKTIKEVTRNNDGEINGIILSNGTKYDVSMLICGLGIFP